MVPKRKFRCRCALSNRSLVHPLAAHWKRCNHFRVVQSPGGGKYFDIAAYREVFFASRALANIRSPTRHHSCTANTPRSLLSRDGPDDGFCPPESICSKRTVCLRPLLARLLHAFTLPIKRAHLYHLSVCWMHAKKSLCITRARAPSLTFSNSPSSTLTCIAYMYIYIYIYEYTYVCIHTNIFICTHIYRLRATQSIASRRHIASDSSARPSRPPAQMAALPTARRQSYDICIWVYVYV